MLSSTAKLTALSVHLDTVAANIVKALLQLHISGMAKQEAELSSAMPTLPQSLDERKVRWMENKETIERSPSESRSKATLRHWRAVCF